MNHFWNLFAYSVLVIMAFWFTRGAVKSVGIYYFSRAVANGDAVQHVCDPAHSVGHAPLTECPATTLISAIEDTHRKVRTEAIVAVVQSLVTLVGMAYALVLLMGRLT